MRRVPNVVTEMGPRPASTIIPPSPSHAVEPSDLTQRLEILKQVQDQAQRSIFDWACRVAASRTPRDSCDSGPGDVVRVPGTMSDMKTQTRSRSSSPTKKDTQYRDNVLRPAGILIDVIHNLPPEIEALLPCGLRDILDPPSAAHPHAGTDTATPEESNEESDTGAKELADKVSQVAPVYRDKCRELARKLGSEPEYRAHLFFDVIQKLARFPPWRCALSRGHLWCPSSTWPRLPPNPITTKASQDASFESNPRHFAVPPVSDWPSESSTACELKAPLATPKPDITVGIAREAFSMTHAGLLNYWQAHEAVISDPHDTPSDMRFPFLIIEAKGPAADGHLIGTQNQAAGGGTCAIKMLDSLAALDPGTGAPRIVFSVTTEAAIKELWIHYRLLGGDSIYMTCLGTWRTTIDRHAKDFATAMAVIFRWGVHVYLLQIKQALDRVLKQSLDETCPRLK